jgi:hypothetical protein
MSILVKKPKELKKAMARPCGCLWVPLCGRRHPGLCSFFKVIKELKKCTLARYGCFDADLIL